MPARSQLCSLRVSIVLRDSSRRSVDSRHKYRVSALGAFEAILNEYTFAFVGPLLHRRVIVACLSHLYVFNRADLKRFADFILLLQVIFKIGRLQRSLSFFVWLEAVHALKQLPSA